MTVEADQSAQPTESSTPPPATATPEPSTPIRPPEPPSISRPRPARPARVERPTFEVIPGGDEGSESEPAPRAPRKSGGKREVPSDPSELEAARKTVAAETQIALFAFNMIAKATGPKTELTDQEKGMLEGPIADVLYKYDLATSPEFRLVAAIGAVFGLRYAASKIAEAEHA